MRCIYIVTMSLGIIFSVHGWLYAPPKERKQGNFTGASVYCPYEACASCRDTVKNIKYAYRSLLKREIFAVSPMPQPCEAEVACAWDQTRALYLKICDVRTKKKIDCFTKKVAMHTLECRVSEMLLHLMKMSWRS